MILLSLCALLAMTARETHTQSEKKLAPNEEGTDPNDTSSMTAIQERAATDAALQNKISYTSRHDYLPVKRRQRSAVVVDYMLVKRRQRSAVVVGKTVMAGLRALKNLLLEATEIPSISGYKLYSKRGGLKSAAEDFESIDFQNVEILRSNFEYGRRGQIGNKEVLLRINKYTKNTSIEIRKLQNGENHEGNMLPGQLTDKIIYL